MAMSPNSAVHQSAAVAIVGGGPVGMMLALFLDRLAVPSVLFNTEAETRWHPKGNTHNSRTMEHYRRVGLSESVRQLGLPHDFPRDVTYFTSLDGWELARFRFPCERDRMDAARAASVTDQVPEPLVRANQMYVERCMHRHAASRSHIAMRFGWTVEHFTQDANEVTIRAVNARGDTEYWRAPYMVGCDGGTSFVRRSMGIRYTGEGASQNGFLSGRMCSTHVEIPGLHRGLLKGREAWMYNLVAPGRRLLLISLDGQDEFLLMTKVSGEAEAPSEEEVICQIDETLGKPSHARLRAQASWYGGVALVAERFQNGRVFLAGDATHLFSPTGGFGMNTGIDGVANLSWKLAAAVQGWGGAHLLDSYETERRPVAYRNTAAAKALTERVARLEVPQALEAMGDAGDAERQWFGQALQSFRYQFDSLGVELGARYDGSPLICADGVAPRDDPIVYRPSDAPGGRLPHLWMATHAGLRVSLFDLLHPGFTLLRVGGSGSLGAAIAEAARARGVPFAVLDIPSDAHEGLYTKPLILVRPDQHVAWRGHEAPADPHRLWDTVLGGVGTPRTAVQQQEPECVSQPSS